MLQGHMFLETLGISNMEMPVADLHEASLACWLTPVDDSDHGSPNNKWITNIHVRDLTRDGNSL